ncbi:zinc ribbon domain-containing protein [Lactococcus lactis]|uniref:zinc ribbon domain-containing protein n=1 Tax=Lactococcus lactis TaxID=1358 RepID=UPI001913665B|nr:zinc ribbon domain-containing protein [Lactococcus lactis]MBK5076254.1 zinc ribbon domain-containing protein [Lactococcus lactis]WDA68858.1 zinc ribbon domain-containing protein [Lactococcus lactis]
MDTEEEWKKGFHQLNDREPSVEEFLEAQANGEIESEEIEQNIKQEQSVSSTSKNNSNIFRKLFEKNKKYFIIAGAVIALVIVVIGVFSFVNSRPKNIINEVKVDFSGYNKQGSATLSGNYKYVMESIIAKKVGYSNSDVQAVQKGNDRVLTADYTKSRQVEKYIEDTTIGLNKESDLSNGDKLILSIKTSLKDNPIKTSKKTIKVSGLKKSTTYTMNDIIKKYPIKITGYNHFGTLDYNDKIYTFSDSSDSSNFGDNEKQLTNGDSIKVYLSSDYISNLSDKGQIIEGKPETMIKVSGLLDSPKISNQSDLLNQIDTVVRNYNKSDDYAKYEVTRQDSYFIGENISASNSSGFSIVSIYKIDDDNTLIKEKTTKYYIYGYAGLKLSGDKINIPALNEDDIYGRYENIYNSAQEALDSLKSKYPSLVKIN